jgi:hypothetical protein
MKDNIVIGPMPKKNVLWKVISFSWMKNNVAVEVICFLFILLFVYAAVSKFIDFENFRIELSKSPVLTVYSRYLAWFIPSLEILISLMLTSSSFKLIGLYASFTLMVLFTSYLIAILKFSFFIPCSCGGILEGLNWDTHIIFNSIFIILSLIAIMLYPNQNKNKVTRS